MASASFLCVHHGGPLGLFCLDHREPICLICRDSEVHVGHRFRPINEAAPVQRQELQIELKPLKERWTLFQKVNEEYQRTAEHANFQVQQTEKMIREQFERFHQFLREEEEARIAALKKEGEQKIQMMSRKIKELSGGVAALSNTIGGAEAELRKEDNISFLKNYQATRQRVQRASHGGDPQLLSGALIDV